MACAVYCSIRRPGVTQKAIMKMASFVLQEIRHPQASMSIHLIGDQRMKTLNSIHRKKKSTTDVLAFPTHEGPGPQMGGDWGDIFISIPQIQRQAKVYHVSFQEEFCRMLVHGILHLFGYDHVTRRQAKEMFGLQEKLVRTCI